MAGSGLRRVGVAAYVTVAPSSTEVTKQFVASSLHYRLSLSQITPRTKTKFVATRLSPSLHLIAYSHSSFTKMAGKKQTAPAQVYVVVSGHHNGIDATIQGVYVDYDAASMASNNNPDLVHVLEVNYNGV